ncbi:transposase-like protein [Pseudoalteromonas sp. MBR-15]|jgi:transposase-like protein
MLLINTINCPHCHSAKITIQLDALCQGQRFSCHLCNTVISLAAEDRAQLQSVNKSLRENSALGQCKSDYATFS